jgi:hypothetical protein
MTQQPKCKLCKQDDATVTGSHFVSACIVEGVYGNRGSEDAYRIDLQQRTFENYKGPSNLQNTDTTIKENFIVADNVFCKACENLFGILENECCSSIRNNLRDLKNGSSKVLVTELGNKYIIPTKIKKNVFQFFMYSLLWRQMLEHQLIDNANVISNTHFEKIRNELLQLQGLSHQQIRKVEQGFKSFDYITFTTYHNSDPTVNPIMANTAMTNPHLFFLGTLSVLLFINEDVSTDFTEKNFISTNMLDKELRHNLNNEIHIGVLNETVWKKIVVNFYKRQIKRTTR